MYNKRKILNNVKVSSHDKLLETCSVKFINFDIREISERIKFGFIVHFYHTLEREDMN